jgi:hypothetical protein
MLDPITTLQIRMHALTRANERVPREGEHRLADFITIDDYRHGVRRAFADEEGFEEWMVTPLLKEFDEAEALHRQGEALVQRVLWNQFGWG